MLNDKFGWNVLAIQIWKNLPFQLLIIASVLETIRTDIEDAARNLGASPLRVIWHIILPLSVPGILIAVVLVFILTFGDYAITRVAGPVYPSSLSVLMYTEAFTLQQWGAAACIGMVIIVTSLLLRRDLCARGARAAGDGPMTAAAHAPSRCRAAPRLSFGRFLALLIIALLVIWTGGAAVHGGDVVAGESGRSRGRRRRCCRRACRWRSGNTSSPIRRSCSAVSTSFILAPIVTIAVLRPVAADRLRARPLRLSAARKRCAS